MVYIKRPQRNRKKESLLAKLNRLDSKAIDMVEQLDSITEELAEVRAEVMDIKKEIAIQRDLATSNKLDAYRY